jgi:hypothetical protein
VGPVLPIPPVGEKKFLSVVSVTRFVAPSETIGTTSGPVTAVSSGSCVMRRRAMAMR